MKTQRRVGDFQGVVTFGNNNRDVGGHAGLEFQIGVIDTNDGIVGDDVLDRDRRVTHLHDLAVECATRKRVDGEVHVLTFGNATDVALRDVGVDLHLRQVVGNDKQYWRAQAGRHGLANVNTP